MPENIKKNKLAFATVSAVLLSLTGCDVNKEVGLCTYLFGCDSSTTKTTDPGLLWLHGTYDDTNDDGTGGDNTMGGDTNDAGNGSTEEK